MENETKHDMPAKNMSHHHHDQGTSYWASWCSPIGLGAFFFMTALAAAITLYTILNLIGAVMTLSHSEPQYMNPSQMEMSGEGAMMH